MQSTFHMGFNLYMVLWPKFVHYPGAAMSVRASSLSPSFPPPLPPIPPHLHYLDAGDWVGLSLCPSAPRLHTMHLMSLWASWCWHVWHSNSYNTWSSALWAAVAILAVMPPFSSFVPCDAWRGLQLFPGIFNIHNIFIQGLSVHRKNTVDARWYLFVGGSLIMLSR